MKKILTIILSIALLVAVVYSPETESKGADTDLQVHFLNVGQGDSILIQNNGENLLIDGGKRSASDKVVGYLEKQGVEEINYVIGTHPHEDHIGGLIEVLDNFDVKNIMLPEVTSNTIVFEDLLDAIERSDIKISTPEVGGKLDSENMDIKILAPNSEKYSLTNDYSIALRLEHGKNSFLFTGDAEKKSEVEMVEEHGSILESDVLKAGHHGSKTSSNPEFLDLVDPAITVISVAESNSYDHPSSDLMEIFNKRDIDIYRTDEDGDIIMKSDGKVIKFVK